MNGKSQLEKWLKEISIKNLNYLEKLTKVAGARFELATFGL